MFESALKIFRFIAKKYFDETWLEKVPKVYHSIINRDYSREEARRVNRASLEMWWCHETSLWRHGVITVLQNNGSRLQALVNIDILFVSFVEKTGLMSDFISLFFMECSYFHIKSSLKTFQSILYALIYARHQLIIWSLARTIAQHLRSPHANAPTGRRAEEVWPAPCGQVKEVLCLSPCVICAGY